jgi:hypothetical protein
LIGSPSCLPSVKNTMQSLGLILKIIAITDGDKPQMGPILTKPFTVEAQTDGGTEFLNISEGAAVELRDRLTEELKARGIS